MGQPPLDGAVLGDRSLSMDTQLCPSPCRSRCTWSQNKSNLYIEQGIWKTRQEKEKEKKMKRLKVNSEEEKRRENIVARSKQDQSRTKPSGREPKKKDQQTLKTIKVP
jgi:hypothetical protein